MLGLSSHRTVSGSCNGASGWFGTGTPGGQRNLNFGHLSAQRGDTVMGIALLRVGKGPWLVLVLAATFMGIALLCVDSWHWLVLVLAAAVTWASLCCAYWFWQPAGAGACLSALAGWSMDARNASAVATSCATRPSPRKSNNNVS